MELIRLEDLPDTIKIVEIKNNHVKLKSGRNIATLDFPINSNAHFASLMGHVIGDGHIHKDQRHFHFINKSPELINEVKNLVKEVFDIQRKEFVRRDKETFDLNFPAIVARLLILCGAPIGRKTTQAFSIPPWIENGDVRIKSAFLRSLFDDEAWVETTQGGFCIGIGLNKRISLLDSHLKFLGIIRKMLLELGIKTSNIFKRSEKNGSIQLGFKIIGIENLKNFSNSIGFVHKNKNEKLNFIIKNFKQTQFSKKEAKLKVIEQLQNGPLKNKEIAIRLNRDQKTIWKHLNQLRKRNLVVKIGTKNKVFWKLNNLNNINLNIKDN
jgi:intein/homing endonuclease